MRSERLPTTHERLETSAETTGWGDVMEMVGIYVIGLLLVAVAVFNMAKYWTITVPILILAAIVTYFVISVQRRRRRRMEEGMALQQRRFALKAAEDKAREEQVVLSDSALQLVLAAQELRQTVSRCTAEAAASLDLAESEFAARAFAPFWDAVESAVNDLAMADDAIRRIAEASSRYRSTVSRLDSEPRPFDVTTSMLPNVSAIANRMHVIVRQAQQDFQFSTIFEQRKTNQLLVRGFGNLSSAIGQMGTRIQASLNTMEIALSDQ